MAASTVLLGQQTPRLQLAPPCMLNAAEDAIAVYESCGQRLDDWQELCLRIGCGLREDLNWASFENGIVVSRQNGKGAVIEALCLASLFVWGNRVTIYSAHRGDTVETTKRRIVALITDNPDLLRRCKPINPSDDAIELIGGGRLEFRTRTRAGGRGLTGDLVILDEALELNPEQIAALVPVMLARPYAQLWYFSTVPAFADQHLCTVRERVLAGEDGLAWAEWGVDKGADPQDPAALAAANPALNIRITLERLRQLRRILGEEKFATECLGIWPSMTAGSVLDPLVWRSMKDVGSRRADGADLVLSLDMTPLRDHGSIGMHALRADGLEHVQLVDYRPGVDWMVARAAELKDTLDPALFVVQRKNGAFALAGELAEVGITPPGDPLCEDCGKGLCRDRAHKQLRRGDLLVLDAGEEADAVGQFIDGFRARRYRHHDQEPLNVGIANARPRTIGDAGQIAWGRKLSAVDIGPVVVVTDARYGSAAWLTRQAEILPEPEIFV